MSFVLGWNKCLLLTYYVTIRLPIMFLTTLNAGSSSTSLFLLSEPLLLQAPRQSGF